MRRLFLDLDPYGGTGPLGMFPHFLKIRPRFLVYGFGGLFVANVTPIPKGLPSTSVANYRPISMTSVLSKVLDRMVIFVLDDFGRQ